MSSSQLTEAIKLAQPLDVPAKKVTAKQFVRASKSILDESTSGCNLSSDEEDEVESGTLLLREAASSSDFTFQINNTSAYPAVSKDDRLVGLLQNNR